MPASGCGGHFGVRFPTITATKLHLLAQLHTFGVRLHFGGKSIYSPHSMGMVPEEGLEPSHLSVPDPKSGASTNSATRA